MPITEYTYTKDAHIELLTEELESSTVITIALDRIDDNAGDLGIFYKDVLTAAEITDLTAIVTAHDKTLYIPPEVKLVTTFERVEDDSKIPYVVATDRPMNHYSYFSCAGDAPSAIGGGNQALFSLLSTDVSKTVDISYNEDVYLKDGLIQPKDAPFGAMVDIDIIHPVYGALLSFSKLTPIVGNFPIEMNTEDKAFIPQGLIVRITIHNATGLNGHDPAVDFKVMGRLELYRKKPAGV